MADDLSRGPSTPTPSIPPPLLRQPFVDQHRAEAFAVAGDRAQQAAVLVAVAVDGLQRERAFVEQVLQPPGRRRAALDSGARPSPVNVSTLAGLRIDEQLALSFIGPHDRLVQTQPGEAEEAWRHGLYRSGLAVASYSEGSRRPLAMARADCVAVPGGCWHRTMALAHLSVGI